MCYTENADMVHIQTETSYTEVMVKPVTVLTVDK